MGARKHLLHFVHESKHMPFEEEPAAYMQAVIDFMGSGTVTPQARTALAAVIGDAAFVERLQRQTRRLP